MRKTIFISILICTSIVLSSCAPVAVEKNTADTQIKFEPTLQDRELPWETISTTNYESLFLQKNGSFVLSGSRLMNMFENIMYLGDALQDPSIRHRGHDLISNFYGNPRNTTTTRVEQSLYLEAALGEKRNVLLNLLKNKLQGLVDTYPALNRTVPKVKAAMSNVNSLPLSGLAPAIQAMLDNFVVTLQAEGGLKMVWKELKAEIDEKYRPQILEMGEAFNFISPAKSIRDNTKLMRVVLRLPLNPKTLKDIEFRLNSIDDISQRLEKLDSSYEGMKVLLDIWLMLDDQARQKTFKQMNSPLYYTLYAAGDLWIYRLKENKWNDIITWAPEQILVRRGLQGIIKYYGVEKLRAMLLPEMQKSVPASFEASMKKEILALPDLIASKIKEKMAANETKFKGLLIGTNYRQFFVDMSVKWGKREIYDNKDTTNGLERDRYRISVSADGDLAFAPDTNVGLNSTTSSVLGSSFSAAGKRLERVTEFENTSYDQTKYFQMVMGVLNKIPALGGFTMIDNRLYPSFHVLKGGKDVFEKPLDIKTQMGSDNYFVVPDYLALNPPYLMDREGTQKLGMQFGVASQAELLRGMSFMVEYFRDWRVSGFDVKMGRYKLGDLIPDLPPHLEFEMLFPKDKLFEYCLGISSIVLENLKREGSSLVLLDPNGKVYFGNQIDEAKKAQALMAALVDVKIGTEDREDTVRTADLARFIMAMGKFVTSIEGFENSKSQVLNKVEDGEKKLVKRVRDSVAQVKLLMAMMSNFLVHKMQRPDGSMDSSYSLRIGKVISNSRKLEDQLLAIEALLTTGETLGMGVYLGSAYDIYFGMNHVFFKDKMGFYSASDRAWIMPDAYLYTEVLTALTRLSKKTDFSRGQIDRLIGQFRVPLAH
jgi:hypothetical protein